MLPSKLHIPGNCDGVVVVVEAEAKKRGREKEGRLLCCLLRDSKSGFSTVRDRGQYSIVLVVDAAAVMGVYSVCYYQIEKFPFSTTRNLFGQIQFPQRNKQADLLRLL